MTDLRLIPVHGVAMLRPTLIAMGVIASALTVAAFATPAFALSLMLLSAATTLFLIGIVVFAVAAAPTARERRIDAALSDAFDTDRALVFATDPNGYLLWSNARAAISDDLGSGPRAHSMLVSVYADPEESVDRLLRHVGAERRIEERVTLTSGPARLTVRQTGNTRLLWAITEMDVDGAGTAANLLRLRFDVDGKIDWIAPALLDRLGETPVGIEDLLVEPPLRSDAIQDVRLGEAAVTCLVSVSSGRGSSRVAQILPVAMQETDGQFDRLPVPILQLDESGAVTLANRAARELLLLEDGETALLSDLVEGLGRPVGEWLGDAFQGRMLNRPEVARASRAVGDMYVQITLDQVRSGGSARMMAVLHDATELKTLEAQFVQSQKMQAIGQLAGGVAHDFNNLLTAISGHCDLLLLRHEPSDQNFADLEQINQNASRAASLVGQLLAFSRKQNLRPEPLDLRDILSDLTHLLNRLVSERVSLSFEHDAALRVVRADKRQLEQVIMNLVVNARDAMPDGGPIRIRTEQKTLTTPLRRDRVEVPSGSYVVVQVIDEGKGIPGDKLHKIFEPFFTTKKTGEGTGLGLSTAYGIVKQTGGYIFADSVLGAGTTFSLYFPAFDRPAQAMAPPPNVAVPSITRQCDGVILLVEDEAPVRAFAARALRMRGYTVLEAEHAEAALELLADPDLRIDVFVSDVIMPGRDGPSWVREALVARPDTRVIFVSGYAEESFAENQARIPNSVFLPKPFSLVDLTLTVQSQMEDR